MQRKIKKETDAEMTDIDLIHKEIKGVITMILQMFKKIKYEHFKKR